MPTGYTAKLMEEGQTFKEFVMLCARAMGACVMIREEPLSAFIPLRFEPSTFYLEELQEAKHELEYLESLTEEQWQLEEKERIDEVKKRHEEIIDKNTKEDERLRKMKNEVLAWIPPTKDHGRLKAFMLEQIRMSFNGDWSGAEVKSIPLSEAISRAKEKKMRAQKAWDDEVSRCEARTRWIQQLRDSLSRITEE